MAIYTTEVKTICEYYGNNNQPGDYLSIDTVIDNAIPSIFQRFPIFDEAYRNVLCHKILKHFYTREIGFETVSLWKLKLNVTLDEIMPYYNQMYKSATLEFNPLYNFYQEGDNTREIHNFDHRKTDTTGKADSTTHGTNENHQHIDNTAWDKFSETPQGNLQNVENGDYLSSARQNTIDQQTDANGDAWSTVNGSSTTGTEDNGEYHNNDHYISKVFGKNGTQSYSKMIEEYRAIILNIDLMIIDELNNLFITLYN